MKSPRVSVVMLSYNYEKYLDRAIGSVLNQTYQDFEIIVVDDGSGDSSPEILRRYEAACPDKIKILMHPGKTNRGIVKSYELAFSKAGGEFLAFLEADDFWYTENLERKIKAFEENPEAGAVFSGYEPFGDFPAVLYWKFYRLAIRRTIPAGRPVDLFGQFLRRNPVASFTHFMMRRYFLEKIRPAPVELRNYDWWLLGHLSVLTLFYFIPEKLTAWRIHRQSSGYGRVGLRALVRLRTFLTRYYQSLRQMMNSGLSLRGGRKADEAISEGKLRLLRSLRSLAMTNKGLTATYETTSREKDLLQKKEQLEGAASFLEALRARQWGFIFGRMVRHPFAVIRFLSFIFLRNLMFAAK